MRVGRTSAQRGVDSQKVTPIMLYPHSLPRWAVFFAPSLDRIFDPELDQPTPAWWQDDDDPEHLAAVAEYEAHLEDWNRCVSIEFESFLNFYEGRLDDALGGFETVRETANRFAWPKTSNTSLVAKIVTHILMGNHSRARLDLTRLRTVAQFHGYKDVLEVCFCLDSFLWLQSDGATGSRPTSAELDESSRGGQFDGAIEAVRGMVLVVDGRHLDAAGKFEKASYVEEINRRDLYSLLWRTQAARAYQTAGKTEISAILWEDLAKCVDTVHDDLLRVMILDGTREAGVIADNEKAA